MFLRSALPRNAAGDAFTAAFLRACSDTARWDVAVAVASKNNDDFGAARAKLVASIRDRDWLHALQLVDTASGELHNAAAAESSLLRNRCLDIARLSFGVLRLMQRKQVDNIVWRRFVDLRVAEFEQLQKQHKIDEATCSEATHILNQEDTAGDDAADQNSSGVSYCPAHRQTQLTQLVSLVKNRGRRHGSGGGGGDSMLWLRAMQLCFPPTSSSNRRGTIDRSGIVVHAAHVNALLVILMKQEKTELARALCFAVLLRKVVQQEDSRRCSSSTLPTDRAVLRRRFSSLLPVSFEATSGTLLSIAEFVRETRDPVLALTLLQATCGRENEFDLYRAEQQQQNNSSSSKLPRSGDVRDLSAHMFPYAAWAASDVLRRSGNWQAAVEWFMLRTSRKEDENSDQKLETTAKKLLSHMKLASCVASAAVHQGGVRWQDAVAVCMRKCERGEALERIVESLKR